MSNSGALLLLLSRAAHGPTLARRPPELGRGREGQTPWQTTSLSFDPYAQLPGAFMWMSLRIPKPSRAQMDTSSSPLGVHVLVSGLTLLHPCILQTHTEWPPSVRHCTRHQDNKGWGSWPWAVCRLFGRQAKKGTRTLLWVKD